MFHYTCYETWRNEDIGNTCPMCRTPINKMPSEEVDEMLNTLHDQCVDLRTFFRIQNSMTRRSMHFDTYAKFNYAKNKLVLETMDVIVDTTKDVVAKNPCLKDRDDIMRYLDVCHAYLKCLRT